MLLNEYASKYESLDSSYSRLEKIIFSRLKRSLLNFHVLDDHEAFLAYVRR